MRNEASIDAGIASAQTAFFVFLQERLRALWDMAWKFGAQVQAAQPSQSHAGGGAAPATGSPAEVVSNLWRTYGPTVLAGLTRPSGPAPPNPAVSKSEQSAPPLSYSSSPVSTPGTQPYSRSPFSTTGTE